MQASFASSQQDRVLGEHLASSLISEAAEGADLDLEAEDPESAPSSAITANMDAALNVDIRDGGLVKHAGPRQSFVTSKVVAVVVYVAITVVTLIAHVVSAFVYSKTWTLERKLFHLATYDICTEHNSFEAIFSAVFIRFICAGFAMAAVLSIELDVPGGWPEPGEDSPANSWSKSLFWRAILDVSTVATVVVGWLLVFWQAGKMLLERFRPALSSAKLLEEEDNTTNTTVQLAGTAVPLAWMQGADPEYELFSIQERLFEQAH